MSLLDMFSDDEPTNQDMALISISAFGILLLMSMILFWHCHLRYHQDHPVYRIRHPKFWIVCVCLISFQITWKGIITYLRVRSYMSILVHQILNQFGILLLGYGCIFARGFVLWYTVKCQQHEQNLLFRRVLTTEYNVKVKKPFLYQYEQQLSNPFLVFCLLQSVYFILCVVGGILAFAINTKVFKLFTIAIALIMMCITAILVLGTWCTGRKRDPDHQTKTTENIDLVTRFMDYFNFRNEITIILILLIIFVPLRSWMAIKFQTATNGPNSNKGLILITFTSLFSLLFPVLAQTIIPYWTYSNRTSSKHPQNDVTLFDVLRDRHGFFLFVNHAVQEFNLENISCLIALYQFKKMKTLNDKKVTVSDVSMAMGNDNEDDLSSEMHDAVPDLVNVTSRVETPTLRASLSSHTSAKDVRFYTMKVLELPWNDLPLTDCTFNVKDSKYIQAKKIHAKYFELGNIHTVNVAGVVRNHLAQAFWKIRESESDVLEVFDVVLPNICGNLEDMMDRFRFTEGFESFMELNRVPCSQWTPVPCPNNTPPPT
eukprot:968019_1